MKKTLFSRGSKPSIALMFLLGLQGLGACGTEGTNNMVIKPAGSCPIPGTNQFGWPSVKGQLDCTADTSVCSTADPCNSDTLACKSVGTPAATDYKCEAFKALGDPCQWNLQCGAAQCISGKCGTPSTDNPDMGTTMQTCDAPGKVRTADNAVCAPVIGANPSKLEWVVGDFVRTYQTGGGRCTFIEARNGGGAESTVANPADSGVVYSVALTPSTTSVIAYNCQSTPTIYAVGRRDTRVINSMALGTNATTGATTSL